MAYVNPLLPQKNERSAAKQPHAAGNAPAAPGTRPANLTGVPREYAVVGRRVPLVDALRKTTGEGVYTDDLTLPNLAVGRILRSPHAHARIVAIDTAEAEALPGVFAVVTGREAPNRFGVLPISRDETAMAIERVRHVGEPLAGVAAQDEATALAALAKIRVTYEPLPAVMRPEDALAPTDAPIHAHSKDTNIHKAVEQHFGDVEAGFARSAVVRGDFQFASVTHAFTEPMCTLAHLDPDGRLICWSAQQVPHYLHLALATVMEMPLHKIRVIMPMVGGGFGGKSDPFPHEMICCLLARKAGRPVKILFDREEVFFSHHGRHPTRCSLAIGADPTTKKLTGIDIRSLIDGGAYGSFGVVTTYYNGVLSQGPYRFENFRYSGRRVYTNKPPHGAMRGHGAVNTRYAIEVLIDELAEKLELDPFDLRLANLIEPYSETLNKFRITSLGIRECLERVRAASGWDERRGKLPFGHGLGLGCGFYISGSGLPIHRTGMPMATVHIKLDFDGGVTVHTGAADIGQGSDTVAAQMAAEVLGLPLERVHVYSMDTDLSPTDLGSYSSRVTFMNGNAALRAAEKIANKLRRAAGEITGYAPELFVLGGERVYCASRPEVGVTFDEAVKKAITWDGALTEKGSYQAPPMGGDFKGAGAGLAPAYSCGAYVTEVKVDVETGFVEVVKVWAAHDCGRALNPLAVEGQIEGCIHMGLGQALCEEFAYEHKGNEGNVVNANLLDYRTLTATQMPEVECHIVESNDPEGPFGAKEAGEGPLLPALPSLGNALHDAIGVRFRALPITPERVHAALNPTDKKLRNIKPRPVPEFPKYKKAIHIPSP